VALSIRSREKVLEGNGHGLFEMLPWYILEEYRKTMKNPH
jgi:hypothetical protein